VEQIPLGVRIHDRATFASFFVGDNAQVVATLAALARPDGFGILYLHGPPGSGKSHLLQALCAAVPGSAYFPLLQLQSLGPAIFDGCELLPAIAIDGLEQVAGQGPWEQRLFSLYAECDARRTRLLIAGTELALNLGLELPDLRSRLTAVDLPALRLLNDQQQVQALKLRASTRGLELPDEAALYLQRRYPRDMATLHALLDQLDAASLREQRRLTVPFIREVIRESTAIE
jgi:DnaA-homolog protein